MSSRRHGRTVVGGRVAAVCPALLLTASYISRCATYSRSPVTSSGPGTLKARGNALRRTARSKHSVAGCRCAPRPGARRSGSGRTVRLPGPPDTVIRSKSAGLDRFRHPMQVRSRALPGRASALFVTGTSGCGCDSVDRPRDQSTFSGSGVTSVSGRMSIRQPVSRAARRAFCPSLPIASDS